MKFNFQAQDSFLEYFFLRFGDLKKRITLSEKKPPLELSEVQKCAREFSHGLDFNVVFQKITVGYKSRSNAFYR